jgi:ArsR family transcriptional regulator
MPTKDRRRTTARAKIIKSLAHPSRLLMVEELSERERCVCELAELVGSDISTVSKHLSILKNAGIVDDEKRGAMVFYRLRTRCVLRFLDCVEAMSRESGNQRI